jgi:uncharacterized protein (DUF2267 family)
MELNKPFIVKVAEQIAGTSCSIRDEQQALENISATITTLRDQLRQVE